MLTSKKGTVLVVAVTAMMIMMIIGFICFQIYTNQSILDTYDQVTKRTFYSAEGAIEMMKGYIEHKTDYYKDPIKGDVMANPADLTAINTNRGFLVSVTPFISANNMKDWEPFKDGSTHSFAIALLKENFDGTMHPGVKARVYLHRLRKTDEDRIVNQNKINFIGYSVPNDPSSAKVNINSKIFRNINNVAADDLATEVYKGYEIVAISSATHKTALSNNTISTTLRYYFYTVRTSSPVAGTSDFNFSNKIQWVGWRRD